MYIRCVKCKSATRTELGRSTHDVTCKLCGRTYDLSAAAKLGSTPLERYRRALAYSQANGLDLASAYSVLLGIMPLEMGRAIQQAAPTPVPEAAAASDATIAPTEECSYDVAFKPAVDQGHLTVRQAIERGDRVVFASKLVQKRGLKMSQAFIVADNRLTILAALRMTRRSPRPRLHACPPTRLIPRRFPDETHVVDFRFAADRFRAGRCSDPGRPGH